MEKFFLTLILIFSCVNLYAKTIEKGSIKIFNSNLTYELQLSENWNDPGEFNDVNIFYQDKNIKLENMCYISPMNEKYLSSFINKTKPLNYYDSKYFLSIKNKNSYLLIFFECSFASDPNMVNVLSVTKTNIIQSFKGYLHFIDIQDLNNDKNFDFIGRETLPQRLEGSDQDALYSTYDPFSIFIYNSDVHKFVYNETLSKKYNEENYIWAGSKMSEQIRIKIKDGKYSIE